MSSIHLLTYNNYYNRIVKQENSLVNYATYQLGSTLLNVNFNPNDGVDTELLIGKGDWAYATPDYLIESDNINVLSRWFILECTRTRAGQYKLTLHRDVIVDNFNAIKTAPMFVERATLDDSDPMIFNKENVSFNQIKTSETLLKDSTGCPWLVGFISSSNDPIPSGQTGDSFTLDNIKRGSMEPDITVTTLNNYWSRYNYLKSSTPAGTRTTSYTVYGDMAYDVTFKAVNARHDTEWDYKFRVTDNEVRYKTYDVFEYTGSDPTSLCLLDGDVIDALWGLKNNLTSSKDDFLFLGADVLGRNSTQSLANIEEDKGKILYVSSTGKYYTIYMFRRNIQLAQPINITQQVSGNLEWVCRSVVNNTVGMTAPTATTPHGYEFGYPNNLGWEYKIELIEISSGDASINVRIPKSAYRTHLLDAPYDMFIMPYANGIKFYNNGVERPLLYEYSKDIAMNAVMAMSSAWSSGGYLYDIQLLPYCPLGEESLVYDEDGEFLGIEIANLNCGSIEQIVDSTTYKLGYFPFMAWSEFTEDLDYSIAIDNPKVQNETDMWRLCSPSYGAMFEFNAAKNGGVTLFNVDCQYKPFTPYIHVNPNFDLLYGQDYNDARGLICDAQFSLPIVNDQWKTYELQNKNYQAMFDRQIQNMETNYEINRNEAIFSGIAGIGSGAASGALTGSMVGGGVGAAIGGALGAGASIGGMVADLSNMDKRQGEALSYATDTFNMQLDNIKALPNTLTRVSSFNNNNKIFPVLEYYTCTDVEKEAFEEKLKYNGMTVGRIGKLEDFIKEDRSFFRGKLIRLENIADDFHMLTAIANEIQQGVFI